jgi:hypothetical protein
MSYGRLQCLRGKSGYKENSELRIRLLLNLHLRVVLCELDQRGLQPQTEYPDIDNLLTPNLKPTAELNSNPEPNLPDLNQFILSTKNFTDTDHLGLGAHSIYLLDRLLFVIRSTTGTKETKFAKLMKLDSKIRNFLEVLMGAIEWTETLKCVHVAICVR